MFFSLQHSSLSLQQTSQFNACSPLLPLLVLSRSPRCSLSLSLILTILLSFASSLYSTIHS
jgi:hypothetical protein